MAQDGRDDERLEVCIRYNLDYCSLELRHDVLLANNKLTGGLGDGKSAIAAMARKIGEIEDMTGPDCTFRCCQTNENSHRIAGAA
jgi:hypothetical protein